MMLDDKNVGTKSDIRQGKITGNFHFVRRPWVALRVSPPFAPFHPTVHQIPGDRGVSFPFLFRRFPTSVLIPLYLSFELYPLNLQLWKGRRGREHAGHVFAKVCAPNTKAV